MKENSEKYFDVPMTNAFFGDIETAINDYETYATTHLIDVDAVISTNKWQGEDAKAAKQALTKIEKDILGEIIQLQKDVNDIDEAIITKFGELVDDATDAYVSYDIIDTVNKDFKAKYTTFRVTAMRAEKVISDMQNKYSKYGTISTPDFTPGHDAFDSFCGGEEEASGYLYDCMKKLVDFDSELSGYITEQKLGTKIEKLNRKMCLSVSLRHPEYRLGHYVDDIEKFDSEYQKILTVSTLHKDPTKWTIEEARRVCEFYHKAVVEGDADGVQKFYQAILIDEQYKKNVTNKKDGARYDGYRSYLDPNKCYIIMSFMADMGYEDTEAFTKLETMSRMCFVNDIKKGPYSTKPNVSILTRKKDYGIAIYWSAHHDGELYSYQDVFFSEEGLSNKQKYDLVKKDEHLTECAQRFKGLKDVDRVKELDNVYNDARDKGKGKYDVNLKNEDNYLNYRYINDDAFRAAWDSRSGGSLEDEGYNYLTKHQIEVYNYLYYQDSKNGTDLADEYLDLLKPSLRQQAANVNYRRMNNGKGCDFLEKATFELGFGCEEIFTGIANYFNLNDDRDGVAMITVDEYVDSKIMANAGEGESFCYSVCKTAGAMTPGVIITVGTGGVGTPVATGLSMAVYGISSGGNAKAQAERAGYTQEQARDYGNAVAFDEACKIAVMSYVAGPANKAFKTVPAPIGALGKGVSVSAIEFVDEACIKPGMDYFILKDKNAYKDLDFKQIGINSAFAGGTVFVLSCLESARAPKTETAPKAETVGKKNFEAEGLYDGNDWYEYLRNKYGVNNVEWSTKETLSYGDRLRVASWGDNIPTDEMYIKYKSVYQNDLYFNQATGEILWPANNGFAEYPNEIVLKQGTIIDRYGSDFVTYVSPDGTPYEMCALAPGTELKPYSRFEVLKDIKVEAGEISPWFDEPGGGTQYRLPETVDDLIDGQVLRRIPENGGSSSKIDYGLVKDYVRDVELKTGKKIPKNQIEELKNALRNKEYTKLTTKETVKHRNEFNKIKNQLIKEWEANTGQKWPTYTEDVISPNTGKVVRKAGDLYDAHHIIENSYGGEHEWWNIHPAKFPNEHQSGIHGVGSPANKLFSGDK